MRESYILFNKLHKHRLGKASNFLLFIACYDFVKHTSCFGIKKLLKNNDVLLTIKFKPSTSLLQDKLVTNSLSN
jgi:hypothetical protein